MIDYVLSNKKFIGMVQPKNDGSKNLFATGCLGKITAYNETEDNRYIQNLKGLSKFTIKKEKSQPNLNLKNKKFLIYAITFD